MMKLFFLQIRSKFNQYSFIQSSNNLINWYIPIHRKFVYDCHRSSHIEAAISADKKIQVKNLKARGTQLRNDKR